MTNILVCGSRTIQDSEMIFDNIRGIIESLGSDDIQIVSGGARGPDAIAIDYAAYNNVNCKIFNAEWDKYGKRAGFIRNSQMRDYCRGTPTVVLAIWDGQSKGTKHMIDLAEKTEGFTVRKVIL